MLDQKEKARRRRAEKLAYAISEEPIEDDDSDPDISEEKASKYEKYHTDDYKPTPHEYTED